MKFSFLIYVSRSGSTLFSRLISSHVPGLVTLPETAFLVMLLEAGDRKVRAMSADELANLIDLDYQFDNLELGGERLQRVINASVGKGIRVLTENIVTAFAERHNLAAPEHVLIKRGNYLGLYEKILTVFPEATFMHIFRDPRAVANSLGNTWSPYLRKTRIDNNADMFDLAKLWPQYLRDVEAFDVKRVREYSFESLCTEPATVLKDAADFIGRDYVAQGLSDVHVVGQREKSIHSLVNKAPLENRTQAWRESLPGWKCLAVEMGCASVMRERGYVPECLPEASFVTRLLAYSLSYVLHLFNTTYFYFRKRQFLTSRTRKMK